MKSIVYTQNAPNPIGPYSQAVKAGNMLFISGQIAIDPVTNELVRGDVKSEAIQVMRNISALLEESDFTFADVVKTSIFLSSMDHFAIVNEIYGSYFQANFPARETIAVLGLPKNVNVEISITAYRA